MTIGCGGGMAGSSSSTSTGTSGGSGSGSGSGSSGGSSGGSGGGSTGSYSAGRTKYVRADSTTEYGYWINPHWEVYEPASERLFVTDPSSNRVVVLDVSTETEIATISVPGAFGIDDTPDHSTLYVGTEVGDLYSIDPTSMTVTARYPSSAIGPGFSALEALVLADGRLALLGEQGGIPSVDGATEFAIWNPSDNAFTLYGGSGSPMPCGLYVENIGGFSRSIDRTKIILGSVDGGGLCEVDEETGQGMYGLVPSFSMSRLVQSPDGNYFVFADYPGKANVYDAHTLSLVTQYAVSGDTSSAAGFFISADSKTLFVPSDAIIYAYDLLSGNPVGWLPNIFVPTITGGSGVGPVANPNFQANDGTGLFFGPAEEGVGFLDTSTMQTMPVGTQLLNGYLNPATGPVSGGTAVQIPEPNAVGPLGAIYFGPNRGTGLSGDSGTVSANAPAGNPGPVDVSLFTTDGGIQLLPEAFSYGPTVLEVTPNMSAAEGGTGTIYGYGLGPTSSTTIPSSLRITVGGKAAQVTSFAPNAYPTQAPPFPLQSASYTIPSGLAGSSEDVVVSTSSGSATAHAALTYLPGIRQFPLPGASLAQGVYDPYADLYYFTDANRIQVFSKTLASWMAPINIPAPGGAEQRLWGIGLSPDGSKLAVADAAAGVIYLLDPSNPTSVQTFPVNANNVGLLNPAGVAVSDSGNVYYTAVWNGILGASAFYKLDTTTGIITSYDQQALGSATDSNLQAAITSDNSRVFFNDDGQVFYIDTATDERSFAAAGPGCCYGGYDLALSSNGEVNIEGTSYFYDQDLNATSYESRNDRENLDISYVYQPKLSADGDLLFQPFTNGIDVYDARRGNLLDRIALPVALSTQDDALVSDGVDNVLIAITGQTGTGIAIVDLSSIAEPTPWPFLKRTEEIRGVDGPARSETRSIVPSRTNGLRPGSQPVPFVTRKSGLPIE